MGYVLLLVVVGVSLFVSVYMLARFRQEQQRYTETLPESAVQVNLLNNNDAVVVAEGRGRLVFANPKARLWFGLDGGEPDLELMANAVQPADTFLELFSKEGQASFRIGNRRVEATSHYIPRQDVPQIVVVMRELLTANYDQNLLDPVQAMNVVSEIGQVIGSNLRLDETLDSILTMLGTVIPFDVGEITLWDEDLQILRSKGRSGESSYFEEFDSTDGVYHLDDSLSGWIARYRQPLLVADTSLRPDVRPKLKDFPFKSYIGVPLVVNDRFIGTLELGSRSRVAFDHEDMALLQTVAGQAGIAVENARLYQNQTERVAELTGLQQIAGVMTSLRDRRQMYAQLTDHIALLMNVEMCGILLYDAQQEALIGQPPFHGVPDAIVSMYRISVAKDSVTWSLYNHSEWWFANNVRADDLVQPTGLLSLAEAVGVRTTAVARMMVGERHFGVIQVANKRDGSGFSENDMRLLGVFASQVAIVVENARLFDEEQRRAEEMGGLQQISQAIGVLRDPGELYSQINTRIAKLMNVQMCGILLYDAVTKHLVSRPPFHGVEDDLIRHYRIPVTPDSAFYELYEGQPYWISNDLRADPILRENSLERLAMLIGVRQTMMVPLIVGGRRLGVVQVSNRLDGNEFTEANANVLSIFATQAAVIIDNARLYREMRERSDESEGLRRIAEVVSGHLSLDEIVEAVAEAARQLLNGDVCTIGLLDERSGELTIRPEWAAGVEDLKAPIVIDTYAPGFQNSVIVSRRSFMTNNLRTDPRVLSVYRGLAERFNIAAVIQVPLVIQERSAGEVIVGNRTGHEFSLSDMRLLESIVAQLASAVDRQRLYQVTDVDLRVRVREMDAITRISNELNRTTELGRILDVIRSEAQRTTFAEAATIVLFKAETEWSTPDEPLLDQRIGAPALADIVAPIERAAAQQRVPVAVKDYQGANLAAQPPEARNAIAAPVFYGEQVVGVLHIYSTKAGAFSEQTEDFVKTLVNQVAIAFGNEARYQDQLDRAELLKQRTEQLNQIFELGAMLRSGETLAETLEAVAHGITESVGFNIVVISTVDSAAGVTRRVAQAGLPLSIWSEKRQVAPPLSYLDGMLKPQYQISASYFLPGEFAADWKTPDMPIIENPVPTPSAERQSQEWNAQDMLLIPLRGSVGGELIGLISVDDPRDGKRPTRRVIEALEIFGNQAAFAIENFRLVEAYQAEAVAARQERDRLAQLHLVASEIQHATDVPTRLQVVADGICAAGWGRVAITLRDQNFDPLETITSGYSPEEFAKFKENLLSGIVWGQRLADPEFRRYRIGQAYYVRYTDPWVTENKLIAGMTETAPELSEEPRSETWNPLDTVYLPLYGLDRSRLIGIISMDSPLDGKVPTESAMRPIELFAAQAASAIENTRLYQGMINAAQQEARINEVTEAITSTLQLDKIIQSVANGFQQMIAFTRMSVGLLPENRKQFEVLRVTVDMRGEVNVEPGEPIPFENSAMGLAVSELLSKIYHLSYPDQAGEYVDLNAWRESGERTALVVPMVAGGRVVGALHMGSELAEAFGFEAQLPLVSRVANLTAVAIENAQLLQETLGLQSFNESIIQSIQQGIIVIDRDRRIRTVNAFMRRVYHWTDEAISQLLFEYRPNYAEFLRDALENVLQMGNPETIYSIREYDEHNQPVVRNFYVYPLLEGDTVSGIVILVEDVTARTALEADIATRAQQLSVLTDMSTQLTAVLDPDAVVRLVFDQLDRILKYDSATLWLRRGDKLIIQAVRGYTDAESLIGIEAEIADSELFREIASRGQVLNISDITQDRRFPPFSEDHPMRSWLGVSLVSRGNLAGLLVLEKTQVSFYTATMEQLALTFANQAAVALENASLFQKTIQAADENTRLYRETAVRAEELDQQAKRLSLLYRISNALTQSLDLEDIFEVTLRETIGMLGIDRGSAFILESDTQVARLVIEYPRSNVPPDETDVIPLGGNLIIEEIRRTLQPIVARDVPNDPHMLNNQLVKGHIFSTMIVPLTVSGQLIGLVEFDANSDYRNFTPEQIEVAQTIASQGAIAVQNAKLLEQSLARTRELETLFEATQSISATLDLTTVMQNIAMQIVVALEADACEILTWRDVEQSLVVEMGISPERSDTVDSAGYVYNLADFPNRLRALETRQVVQIRADDPNLAETELELLARHGAFCQVSLPMVVREQSIGLIEFEVRNPARVLTPTEVRLARTLAAQAAVAIENARLQTETSSKLEELFFINDFSTALAAHIEENEIYDIVRRQLPSLVKAQWLLLAVLDKDKETINYPVAFKERQPITIESHPAGNDEVSFVMKNTTAQRLAGNEIYEVLRNQGAEIRIMQVQCFLGVPLITGDEVVGALIMGDESNPHAFNLNDQRILSTVGAQIAISIQNSHLFAQTRRFTAELEQAVLQRTQELQRERDSINFLYQLTASLTSSLDIDMTLKRALEMMVRAVEADMGVILGIDNISDTLIYRAGYNLTVQEGESYGITPREGLEGWVIQSQQSVVVPDVQVDYRWLHLGGWEQEPHAAIAALLEANEENLGVVMLYSSTPNKFTEDQLRLVAGAAKQIASAMNNADLYTLIREQAERLGAMVRREQVDSTKNLAIVESIADGVMVANQDGDITQFNSAAERILGLSRRQVIGSHITNLAGLYTTAGGQNWFEAIDRWTNDPSQHRSGEEVRAQLALENGKFVSVILSPVNMGDQFLGTVSVFRDVTREIEVDRMKSEFVATVSHELRTPMTSIKGYADLLLLGAAGQITEQQQRFLSTIKTNADRLSVLVNELLDISRIDRGVVKLNLQPTNLQDVVQFSLQALQERIRVEGKALEVTTSIPDDLPLLRADFDKMTQILNHLVNNAFNYSYAGGTITIEAQPEERSVVISVSDTGIGIPRDKQERIWNRFYRDEEQSLVMESSGAGLGLSLVKEYVGMHDGEIWLESEVGKGSTFYVRIPAFASTLS